jgi:hypothetical protein
MVALAWAGTLLATSLWVFPFLGLLALLLVPLLVVAWLRPARSPSRAGGASPLPVTLLLLGAPAVMTLPALGVLPNVSGALLAESRGHAAKASAEWGAVRAELPLCLVAGAAAGGLELLGLRRVSGALSRSALLIVPLFAGFGPAAALLVRVVSRIWPLSA